MIYSVDKNGVVAVVVNLEIKIRVKKLLKAQETKLLANIRQRQNMEKLIHCIPEKTSKSRKSR